MDTPSGDLHKQLAGVFAHGVAHSPSLAHHLHAALQSEGDKQLTKAEANYRKGSGNDVCGACKHYSDSASCDLVAGNIDANYTCDEFTAAPGGGSGDKVDGKAHKATASGPPDSSSTDVRSSNGGGSSGGGGEYS